CFSGSVASALHPDSVAAVIAIEHGAGIGAGGVGEGKAWVHGHGVFKHLQREFQVLAGLPASVALAALIEIVGLEVFGGLGGGVFEFLLGKGDAKSFGDFAGDFVLNFEDIFHFAVV